MGNFTTQHIFSNYLSPPNDYNLGYELTVVLNFEANDVDH